MKFSSDTNDSAEPDTSTLWIRTIQQALDSKKEYEFVGYKSMVGLFLGIWIAKDKRFLMSDIQWDLIKRGFKGLYGNKVVQMCDDVKTYCHSLGTGHI